MKCFLRLCLYSLLLLVIAAGVVYWKFLQEAQPVDLSGQQEPKIVEIVEGSSAQGIGEQLEREGLIRSALVFRLLVRYGEHGANLKTGHFSISPSSTPQEIIAQLEEGKVLVRKITFPEGLTIEEMGAIVERAQIGTADEFNRMAKTEGKQFGDFPADLLGYLLPDTYEIPWKCTVRDMVEIMTARFDELARPLVDKKSPLDLASTVVLASLVEREAQVDSERPIIAGVYINRLAIDMLLQCDATIQFALGKQKEQLLYSDLDIESPYNTYRHPGLPPGPICSPGLAALQAAAHPQKSDYLFYVRNGIKNDGSHVFSRTEGEHNAAVNKYLR